MDLLSKFPNQEALLALAPEQLAYPLLECLRERRANLMAQDRRQTGGVQFGAFITGQYPDFGGPPPGFPTADRRAVEHAISEAFSWLIGEGLVVPVPENGSYFSGRYMLSRRGLAVQSPIDFANFALTSSFSPTLLHPTIAKAAWGHIISDERDVAVFAAFKAVEVAVKTAHTFRAEDVGADLMRKAFDKDNGPLTDQGDPKAEREGLAHVFAGAFAAFRNPAAHRYVDVDLATALELLMLASHLLRVVLERRARLEV